MTTGASLVPRFFTLLAVSAVGAMMLLSACGTSDDTDATAQSSVSAWSPEAVTRSQAEVKAQQVGSQVGLGPARLAFGILQPDPRDPQSAMLVHNAIAKVTLYQLDGETGTPAGEYDLTPVTLRENTNHRHADGTDHLHDDPLATVYVTNLNIGETEWWGAELSIRKGAILRLREDDRARHWRSGAAEHAVDRPRRSGHRDDRLLHSAPAGATSADGR
jgi:hypothetical protein